MNPLALNLPPTTKRVEEHSSEADAARIEQKTVENLARLALAGPAAMSRRLEELDREWDIERCLEANAATVTLGATVLGFALDRRWFALPLLVGGFLLLHALQGWCPPVPVMRRLGVRTEREINLERMALRMLRGDFRDGVANADEAYRKAAV